MYLSLCWYLCLHYWMIATCSQIVASQRERGSIGSLVEKVFCSEEMFSCQESKNPLSPTLDYLISFKLLGCFFCLGKFGNNSYKKNGTLLCSQKCWKDLGVSSHYFRSTTVCVSQFQWKCYRKTVIFCDVHPSNSSFFILFFSSIGCETRLLFNFEFPTKLSIS